MSLEERLDTDLGELGTDKRNPNGTTRCQSMMVYEDLDWGNWTKIIEISCTPGDSSCSQWLSRVQGKLSFHMVVEVDQQDLETSLRRVWRTRKSCQREEKEDQ